MTRQNMTSHHLTLSALCSQIEACLDISDEGLLKARGAGVSVSQVCEDTVKQTNSHALIRAILGVAVQLERIADTLAKKTRLEK